MAESSKKHDKAQEKISDSSMDLILPSTVLSTILSNLDVRSICCAAAASKSLSIAASQTLRFADSFHILDVAIRMDLLRRLLVLPENLHVKSLKLDCARLDDTAIDILARPSLNEVHLHNCENFNGKLVFELGNKCHELRGLYVSSLAERRRNVLQFSDLERVLKGCSQLEAEAAIKKYQFDIVVKNVSRLCHAKPIVTVNGQFPRPTIYAREGDHVS